jgi:hypothetical protein
VVSQLNISSSGNSAAKLNEDEEDGWHSLQLLGVQFEDYTTCESALAVCGIQSVDTVLDKHFARPDEPEEKEEVIELKQHSSMH